MGLMSDLPDSPFSDEDLAVWIRRHPEVWHYAELQSSDADVDNVEAIIEGIIAGDPPRPLRSGRQRRRVVGGACVVAVVVGGAVGAAALIRSGQPSAPEAGVVCRAEARVDANAIVLQPGQDPIEGCRALWAAGRFESHEHSVDVPELASCVDPRGAVNVFPGPESVCQELGLQPADPDLTPVNQAIVELQDRLAQEINLAACQPVGEVVPQARGILDETGIEGWEVVIEPGSEEGVCGKTAVDSAARTVTVHEL